MTEKITIGWAGDPADLIERKPKASDNGQPDSVERDRVSGAGSIEEQAPRIVPVADFAAVDEPGATPMVGEPGRVLIPEGGDVMLYGDGGSSKTTLGIDLGFHLATGEDWLGIAIPNPVRVLLIEAEGPRPLFRDKLERKLAAWEGPDPSDRLGVLEEPWARFRFDNAAKVAAQIEEQEIDALIVGPLTRVGMDELGTLQQVRDFMDVVARFRATTKRRLMCFLVHHENKGGKVSGAWEGAGDTLLHATVHGKGMTKLLVQKARWASDLHKQTLKLEWTDGEGFEVKDDPERDLVEDAAEYLIETPWQTVKEIKKAILASEEKVEEALKDERFEMRTGERAKAVGRRSNAHVWAVRGRTALPADSEGSSELWSE